MVAVNGDRTWGLAASAQTSVLQQAWSQNTVQRWRATIFEANLLYYGKQKCVCACQGSLSAGEVHISLLCEMLEKNLPVGTR